ncbi:MAG: pyridoxamine 5'-phosphate oxidase [Candidatus Puniceispirillaceae bacterium]
MSQDTSGDNKYGGQSPLHSDVLDADPFELFGEWFEQAKEHEINDPDAMAIASVAPDGMPSVRMVLLKQWSRDGFVFFTNYDGRKGLELLHSGKAAFVMHWKSLRRQVRVSGTVSQADSDVSDAYFQSRPRGSQIGAWASIQSRPLERRADLAERVRQIEETYPDKVMRPPHWGGFIIKPQEIEFWADGAYRLHDRFKFTQDDKGIWSPQRLYP